MAMQQNHQRKRTRASRPGDVSLDFSSGAGIKETSGLLALEGCQLFIRYDPNRVTGKQKQQADGEECGSFEHGADSNGLAEKNNPVKLRRPLKQLRRVWLKNIRL